MGLSLPEAIGHQTLLALLLLGKKLRPLLSWCIAPVLGGPSGAVMVEQTMQQ